MSNAIPTIYEPWHKALSNRLVSDFTKPKTWGMEKFALPYHSAIHNGIVEFGSMADDIDAEGVYITVPMTDPIFASYSEADKLLNAVVQYVHPDVIGKPVRTDQQVNKEITELANADAKLFVYNKNLQKADIGRSLLIYSYCPINDLYRYPANQYTGWYRWYNEYQTMCWKIEEGLTKHTNRNHFIVMGTPVTIPSLSVLETIYTGMTKIKTGERLFDTMSESHLKLFNNDLSRYFIDLWLLVAGGREFSIIGKKFTLEQMQKINIVYLLNGQWATFNLGHLMSLMKENTPDQKAESDRNQFKRKFLYFSNRLFSIAKGLQDANEIDPDAPGQENADDIGSADYELDIEKSRLTNDVTINIGESKQAPKKVKSQSDMMADLKSKLKKIDNGEKLDEDAKQNVLVDEESLEQQIIDRDLQQLEVQQAQAEIDNSYGSGYKKHKPKSNDLESTVDRETNRLFKSGVISAKEVARVKNAAKKIKTIKDPFGSGKSIEETMKIDPKDLVVPENNPVAPEIKGVRNKGYLNSSITTMERRYIKEVMSKDILNSVTHLQRAGYAIEDYKIEKVTTAIDRYELHRISVMTPRGVTKTIPIQIPTLDDEGVMLVGGVKSRMRPQKGDRPLRKVSPVRVALSSYSSKIFIERTERSAFNYQKWLIASIVDRSMTEGQQEFLDIKYGKVFNPEFKCPRQYSIMARRFSSFIYKDILFSFDAKNIEKVFTEESRAYATKHKLIPFAKSKSFDLYFNKDGKVVTQKEGQLTLVGTIESVLDIDDSKKPVDYVEYQLLGDTVPLGFILAYHVGLGNLIETLGCRSRRVPRGSSLKLTSDEYAIRFNDESIVLSRNDEVATLILAGFNRYKGLISAYSVYQFDDQDTYGAVIAKAGISPRKLVEIDTAMDIWVDPITLGLLEKYSLPTDLFGLLIEGVKLLTHDQHKDKNDRTEERDKGLERIAGTISRALYETVRKHKSSVISAKQGLDLNPKDVWMTILLDPAVMGVEESNPIHNLKDQEELILGGVGGRSTKTMMASDRKYHKSSLGSISCDTVDSAEVAAKIFRTADPCYDDLRGTTFPVKSTREVSRVFSTSSLTCPAAYFDDPKRINFINIQNSSTTMAYGYTPMPFRTGYERVIPHRAGKTWANMAAQDGVVVSNKNKVLKVKYADGSLKSIAYGDTPGKWSGKMMSHSLICELKTGDSFKQGNPLVYNQDYFKRDSLYPDQIIFAGSMLCTVALIECDATYEDSCLIDEELAGRMKTKFSKPKYVTVPFDHDVKNLVKVGDEVEADSALCILLPPLSSSEGSRQSAETLALLEKNARDVPKAKVKGRVTYIRVLYTGDIEEMSDSLQKLCEEEDIKMFQRARDMGDQPYNGYVSSRTRIGGKELGKDVVSIEIHITYDLNMTGSDKLVFGGQMKSVAAGIIQGKFETVSGVPVNAKFSGRSEENRGVQSIYYQGTSNRLLYVLGKAAVDIYKGRT